MRLLFKSIFLWLVFTCLALGGTSDFGVEGLIDMPSARMKSDASFTVAYNRQDAVDFYSLTYQALPWLETSFRYAILDPRLNRGAGDGLRDRSYSVKLRLLEETAVLPEVAVGVQDLFGTGVYGAEYLVASKTFFDNVDLSLGLGWGRLSGNSISGNFLTEFGAEEQDRDFSSDVDKAGKFRPSVFFSGPDIGAFAGVEYRIPNSKLSFVTEYNSDDYRREVSRGSIELDSPFSFGLNWRPNASTEIGLSWQHGSQFGVRLATTSLTNQKTVKRPHLTPHYRLKQFQHGDLEDIVWHSKLKTDLVDSGMELRAAKLNASETEAFIEIENKAYMLVAEAMADVARLGFEHLPDTVQHLTISVFESNMYPVTVRVPRKIYATKNSSFNNVYSSVNIVPGVKIQSPDYRSKSDTGQLSFSFNVGNQVSLFDPDVPLLYQINLKVGANLKLWNNFQAIGSLRVDLDNNFGRSARVSDSVLPHVRSDSLLYLQQGVNGIDSFYLNKFGKVAKNTYYRAFGGILEQQYGGVGGEVLYRSHGSRLAFGVSGAAVRQRDFDQRFGFREYETVVAHASVYWATPYYNYDFAIHAGRYLAKDVGATFELTRRFSNGWQVGLFATFTDVSFDEFGEGSFDKGFIFKIPLESAAPFKSRRTFSTELRPIGRDGGARLGSFSASLWNSLRSSNYDSVYENLSEFIE